MVIEIDPINNGEYDNDPNADTVRRAYEKVNANFENVKAGVDVLASPYRGAITLATPAPAAGAYGTYYPSENGTYTNFGGIVVNLSAGVVQIVYDANGFTRIISPIDTSGLASQSEVDTINNTLDTITENETTYNPLTNPAFANGYFTATSQSTTSGWLRTSAAVGSGQYPVTPGADYYYTGVIDAGQPTAVGVVFFNSGGTRLGTAITSAGTYTHAPLTLPVGTAYIAACSFGVAGPQIGTIVTSKKIPLDSINANVATLEDLAPVQSDVEELTTFKEGAETVIEVDRYYSFNNAEVNFTSDFTVSQNGDYVEWVGKNNNAPGSANDARSLYLFGKKTPNNTIGYFTNASAQDCIRVRASDSTNIEMGVGSGVVWQEWHTIRVQLSGTNWLLYVDGALVDTKAASSTTFLLSNIANAFSSASYAEVSLKRLTVRAQGVDHTYTNFESGTGFTSSGVVAVVNGSVKEPSQCYYTVNLTGSASGNPLVTVYTKIKGNVYQKSKVAKLVNNTDTTNGTTGVRPRTDMWRLYGAEESILENGAFVDTGRVLLHTSENEYAYNAGVVGTDHTGGWHGYEKALAFKILADGKDVSLAANITTPVPCATFEYQQYSEMYVYGNISIVQANHSKRTILSNPGYRVINVLFPKSTIAGGEFYAGLCCTGVGIANQYWIDDLNVVTANGGVPTANDVVTVKTGGDPTLFYNKTGSGYSASVRAEFKNVVLGGVQSRDLWNDTFSTQAWDRSTDLKYYRKKSGLTVNNNDYLWSELELKIELK